MIDIGDFFVAVMLAVVQGATEWFPVSSSGHLVLFESIFGFEGGLLFDVALHFGTLMAVFVYFGRDITDILRDILLGNWNSESGRMGLMLIIATMPAAIVGFFVKDLFDSLFVNLWVVGLGFGITGLFLFITSIGGKKLLSKNKSSRVSIDSSSEQAGKKIGYGKSLLIGFAQVFALVPGVSRSGVTISSGVLLGLNEKNAMKFAFLMSIPIIFGANVFAVGNQTLPSALIWATLVSFVVGLASIHVVFKYVLVSRKNFRWFAGYCLLLALGIMAWLVLA